MKITDAVLEAYNAVMQERLLEAANNNNGELYAIEDLKAQDIAAPIMQIHKNEATATRSFADVLASQNNAISQHPEDYQLIRLGYISRDNTIVPIKTVIMTGKAYKDLETAKAQLKLEA